MLFESARCIIDYIVTHRVAVRRPAQVEVPQLGQVGADNLVRIHEDNLLQAEREENVEEKDFVTPDGSLALRLLIQPPWPLVVNILVLRQLVWLKLILVMCGLQP